MEDSINRPQVRVRRFLRLTALGLLVLFLLSFCLGRYSMPIWQVVKILLSELGLPIEKSWTDTMATVVINIRLPRILLACLVGFALSTSGCAYQGVFQNPMAAPDILGASSGAAFGASLAILLGLGEAAIVAIAFVCSLATVILTFTIGNRAQGKKIVNLILAGMVVSSFFTAGTSYIKLVADPSNQLPAITYWLMGSLSGATIEKLGFAAILIAVAAAPLYLMRWHINTLSLGDDEARAVGINAGVLRITVVIFATLLTATSVAVSGVISWVGLVTPHLCRRFVGNDNRYLVPSTMLVGAFFLLLVDNVSRNLLVTEIPIGILTTFIGAPFFIYLIMRRGTTP